MTAFSNYLENALVNHVLRNTPLTTPGTNVWIALYKSDPTDADAGTEVTGGSYQRKQCTAWDAPANGVTKNTNDIVFDTATSDWGTITHIGVRDAQTNGNLMFFCPLNTSKAVSINDTFKIPAGQLTITLD